MNIASLPHNVSPTLARRSMVLVVIFCTVLMQILVFLCAVFCLTESAKMLTVKQTYIIILINIAIFYQCTPHHTTKPHCTT